MHDGRTGAFDRHGHGAGIGIEQRAIVHGGVIIDPALILLT
jgi:hypothetical protein